MLIHGLDLKEWLRGPVVSSDANMLWDPGRFSPVGQGASSYISLSRWGVVVARLPAGGLALGSCDLRFSPFLPEAGSAGPWYSLSPGSAWIITALHPLPDYT